ncbi:MAG: hydroxymethylbilane synthase [Burkholderia vietnamiensis]|nr:hydroxymethylbilane synthase [Burkholderia vietnamiensis]
MKKTLVIGTRGSALALWQAEHVKARLEKRFRNLEVELRIIKTKGDKILDQSLSKIGDKGLFTREIENALLANKVDIAVHSLKDLPTETPAGLVIAAISEREVVNDALISSKWKSIADLPEGAVIATGSLRRTAQLRHLRPDLEIIDIRGNLNTRMQKFDASEWDAMLLAYAGVKRLGWEHRIAQVIPTSLLLPAVGQGALGIEIRGDDNRTADIISCLHHAETAAAATAERSLLHALEGGCQIPIGAWARMERGRLVLDAMVASINGALRLDTRGSTTDPAKAEALGVRVAGKLLANGAREILQAIRGGQA